MWSIKGTGGRRTSGTSASRSPAINNALATLDVTEIESRDQRNRPVALGLRMRGDVTYQIARESGAEVFTSAAFERTPRYEDRLGSCENGPDASMTEVVRRLTGFVPRRRFSSTPTSIHITSK